MISTKMLILIQKGDRLAMGANLGGLGGRLNFSANQHGICGQIRVIRNRQIWLYWGVCDEYLTK
jgi:hypothetical protein